MSYVFDKMPHWNTEAKLCIFFEQCHILLAQHNVQITGLVVHSMLLMYSPDGTKAFGSRGWEFDGIVCVSVHG